MRNVARVLALLLLLTTLVYPVIEAGGGTRQPTPTPTETAPTKSPEEQAIDHYNKGLGHRDKAWKIEEKMDAGGEAQSAKLEKKALKAYAKAINEFEQATTKNPGHFKAFSSLGYALRKSGRYHDALVAYDRALGIEPMYSEAIEYRAEAYLGLNRVEDAQTAYTQLTARDQTQAAELLEAMRGWVAERRSDPGDVSAQTLNEVERWIEQAEQTIGEKVGHARPSDTGW